jgi:hypothetical protein
MGKGAESRYGDMPIDMVRDWIWNMAVDENRERLHYIFL